MNIICGKFKFPYDLLVPLVVCKRHNSLFNDVKTMRRIIIYVINSPKIVLNNIVYKL